jgi:transposase-like protein
LRRSLTYVQEAELVGLYNSGVKTSELATRFGVSDTTVRSVLRRNGVIPYGKNKRLGTDAEGEIVRLYKSGVSLREVASKAGIVKSTALKVLRRMGVERRPKAHYLKLSVEERARVAACYDGGDTYAEISEKFDISASIIQSCLEEHGIPPRVGRVNYRVFPWIDKAGREFLFQSSWELSYAKHLEALGVQWDYQVVSFKLKRRRVYTPDFQISTDRGIEYHEVKGWLEWYANHHMSGVVIEFKNQLREKRSKVEG